MKTIAICCLTRNRPQMLAAALRSARMLLPPENCGLVFICVENDAEERSRPIIERELADVPHVYALETRQGIAAARNAAMRIAIARQVDAIAFFDDDEIVGPHWIRELAQRMQAQDLHLAGGPVHAIFEPHETLWSRIIARGIASKFRWRAWKKRLRPRRAAICTNNCLIRADVVTQHGIFFDERFKAGSDYRFFLDVRAKGLRHGWAPKAIVSELWPNDRLSISYYFERGRAQAKSAIMSSRNAGGSSVHLTGLVASRLLLTLAKSALLLLVSPFRPAASGLQITRNLGRMVGYVEGGLGRRGHRSIYDKTTGN